MKNSNSFRLKRPFFIWLTGCCYILAGPVHLFLMLFLGKQDPEWYTPVHWVRMFAAFPIIDQTFCILAPLAGIGLLMQRKRSWAFAIAALVAAFLQNLWCIYSGVEMYYPIAIPLAANSLIFGVLYFFRYPYLDRRDSILSGYTKRFPIDMPVKIEGYSGVMAKSISTFGCGLQFPSKGKRPEVHSTIRFEIDGVSLEGVIRYDHEKNMGIRFVSSSRLSRAQLRQFINHANASRKAS